MKTNPENNELRAGRDAFHRVPDSAFHSRDGVESVPTVPGQMPEDLSLLTSAATAEGEEVIEYVPYDFGLSRRGFVQVLGAGLLITVGAASAIAQSRRGQGGGGIRAAGGRATRIHLARDGIITVLTGKVEMGQGARAELTQAAAEELRVPPAQVQMLMADTSVVPDDGTTAGSRTTPATVPTVRQAAAAARQLLLKLAAQRWNVESAYLELRDGKITDAANSRTVTFAELAQGEDLPKAFQQDAPGAELTAVKEWKVLGKSLPRPNRRDLVTGGHKFPSDITRPGMLHGKVLRAPSFGAKLVSIDLSPAKAMKDVVVAQDGSFVGVAAPTSFRAQQALDAVAQAAKWETAPHPSSKELFDHLRRRAQGGVPKNAFTDELAAAKKALRQTYHVPFVQHAPLEPRVGRISISCRVV